MVRVMERRQRAITCYDATWVAALLHCCGPLSEPRRIRVPDPFASHHQRQDARQHPRSGLFRGPRLHPLRLHCSAGCSRLCRALCVEMVLQWREQWLGEEHALQGGHGYGKL